MEEKVEIISRPAFCQKCFDNNHPNPDTVFWVVGGTRKRAFFGIPQYRGRRGFTPHFFSKVRYENGMVLVDRVCGVERCGVESFRKGENWQYEPIESEIKRTRMRIVDWNVLLKIYTHDPDYYL